MTGGNDSAYPQIAQLEEERFNDEFGRSESEINKLERDA